MSTELFLSLVVWIIDSISLPLPVRILDVGRVPLDLIHFGLRGGVSKSRNNDSNWRSPYRMRKYEGGKHKCTKRNKCEAHIERTGMI